MVVVVVVDVDVDVDVVVYVVYVVVLVAIVADVVYEDRAEIVTVMKTTRLATRLLQRQQTCTCQ